MKKLLILMVLALAYVGADALIYYRCTGQNVYVRQGPGKNYSPVHYSGAHCSDETQPYMLSKGQIVVGTGAVKNGFIKVEECPISFYLYWGDGWVSAQYLVKAARCASCKGRGVYNIVCPDCHGQAYTMCSCHGSGKKTCQSCGGIGYK